MMAASGSQDDQDGDSSPEDNGAVIFHVFPGKCAPEVASILCLIPAQQTHRPRVFIEVCEQYQGVNGLEDENFLGFPLTNRRDIQQHHGSNIVVYYNILG